MADERVSVHKAMASPKKRKASDQGQNLSPTRRVKLTLVDSEDIKRRKTLCETLFQICSEPRPQGLGFKDLMLHPTILQLHPEWVPENDQVPFSARLNFWATVFRYLTIDNTLLVTVRNREVSRMFV